MDRRTFIACACTLLGRPLAVEAQPQQAPRNWRIGILAPYALGDPVSKELAQALGDMGYVDGRNGNIEWRSAEGRTERFPSLAEQLVKLQVGAILAIGDLAIRAARQATATLPIVAGSDDLVAEGHVVSLARPGGNVTGVSILAAELNAKRLEVLKAAVPKASRIAALWDPATGASHLETLRAMARGLSVELSIQQVRRADDLSHAFQVARAWHAGAVNILASPLIWSLRQLVIDQAARTRLPAIYQWSEAVREGGLLSYGPTRAEVFRALAAKIDRVLTGAKPSELPIEQPTKFELVINLKTAKTLGLTIPPSLLTQADQVIK
ncbi:MAG: ABC transporter substrate-binding protein [Candidatus Rokuibacteriota bacterium]